MIRRTRDLHEAGFGEELVALDVAGGTYFTFNVTARRVWELLEWPRSVEDICAALAGEYEIDVERARDGVAPLIATLMAEGLVEACDPA